MERLNVTAVVFGNPASVKKWKDAAPNRVIPGTGFEKGNDRISLDELRKDFTSGGMKVMGEISLQYGGISPSDPAYDKYFALAEELDIPVARLTKASITRHTWSLAISSSKVTGNIVVCSRASPRMNAIKMPPLS
jgi:predicted TIM-barrel fold metal-dependent hydrolase